MTGIDDKEMTMDKNIENKTLIADPIMAVLPLNSSTKLDQEPNPFEHSFSGVVTDKERKDKLILPPVASITSPALPPTVIGGGLLPKDVTDQFSWDSLRTGPLSPSMLQGPAHPEEYYNKMNSKLAPHYRNNYSDTMYPLQNHMIKKEKDDHYYSRKRSSHTTDDDDQSNSSTNSKRRYQRRLLDSDDEEDMRRRGKLPEDDEKRKNFLERNRIAALKCRQRKKQWLNNLQAKVEFLSTDNERLQSQSDSLREEIVNLKTLLLAHKECPIAQSNGFHPNAIQKTPMMPMMRPTSNTNMHYNRSTPSSSHSQFQRGTIVNISQPQSGMMAGGSTTIMRF